MSPNVSDPFPSAPWREAAKRVLGPAVPSLRAIRRRADLAAAVASRALAPARPPRAPVFIAGCGRSGTTLVGALLAAHPGVRYYFEPLHRWAAVDPSFDFLLRYIPTEPNFPFDGDVPYTARAWFPRVFRQPGRRRLVEKTPEHGLRLRALRELAPDATIVYVLRDGRDVVRSIVRIATADDLLVGRRAENQWWGWRDAKWRALVPLCQRFELPVELSEGDHAVRAAAEWTVSVKAALATRHLFGERFVELRYDELTTSPSKVIRHLYESLGLDPSAVDVDRLAADVRPSQRSGPLETDHPIVGPFEELRRRLGYEA